MATKPDEVKVDVPKAAEPVLKGVSMRMDGGSLCQLFIQTVDGKEIMVGEINTTGNVKPVTISAAEMFAVAARGE